MKHGTAKRIVIFRAISALAVLSALAAAAAVVAAGAAGPTVPGTGGVPVPFLVPPSLAVPEVPAESARVIVADTLKFRWPPVDSAASVIDTSVGTSVDTSVDTLIDTSIDKPIDTSSVETKAVDTSTSTSAPAFKRPKTRQELGRMSREELFRLAFGRAAPEKPRVLAVRVFGEGRPAGSTEVNYNEDFTAFTFRSPALSRLLDRMILPEARSAAGDSAFFFSSAVMEEAGYGLVVDDTRFELRVSFPLGDMGVRFTDLSGGYAEDGPRGEEIPAAAVSFYVNYGLDGRVLYPGYGYGVSYAGVAREPLSLDLEGAFGVRGWVLEGSGWVREPYGGGPFTWEAVRRDDVRAVRDFAGLRSRLSVGDVAAGTSFLPGPTIGGARYERNGYFFGGDPQAGLNSVAFFMPEAGEVEVYMDGAFKRRLYLPAGHHRVGGFGGSPGRNRVRLLLRGFSGSAEEVHFEYVLSNPRVMARGDSRYAFAAGVRREYAPSPACFSYDAGEPAASVEYAYGIHRAVNAGFSALASRRAGVGGVQAEFDAGGLGFADVRAAASYSAAAAAGGRLEASYTADLKRPAARVNRLLTGDPERGLPELSLALRGYCQTARYGTGLFGESYVAGAGGGVNGAAGGFSGNFAAALWRGSLSAAWGANFYRETGFEVRYYPSDYNYGVRFSQGFGGTYFSLGVGESVRGGVRSPYFALNTNHAFGADFRVGGHRFSASADAGAGSRYVRSAEGDSALGVADTVALEWGYGGLLGWYWSNDVGGSGARVYAADARFVNDRAPVFSASLRHDYNRARLDADYGLSFDGGGGYWARSHEARARLAGSFMFADGLWAAGRPADVGGFALVGAVGGLGGAKVHVNRSRSAGGEAGGSGWLGAAYHNRLTAYAPTELSLSLTDAPDGAFLEQSLYHVVGSYKRGFALRVGGRPKVIVRALLTDKRGGGPLGHTYLTIEPAGGAADEEGVPRAVFTGGDGVLQAGGLAPGCSYRLKFRASSGLRDAVIEVPEGVYGVYEHPVVEVERGD